MTVTKANFGDKITSAIFNENTYYLLKGTAGYEDTVRLADNVDSTFLLQPNTDPGAPAQLFQIKTANGTLKGAFDSSGNLIAAGTATVNGLFAATATINTLSVPTINTTNVTGMTAGTLVVSGEASINTLFASTATINTLAAPTINTTNIVGVTAGTLTVTGQASVNTLMATGAATFAGNVNVEGTLTAVGALSYTNLTITGTASINSIYSTGISLANAGVLHAYDSGGTLQQVLALGGDNVLRVGVTSTTNANDGILDLVAGSATTRMRIYADGGVFVGSSVNDPGANNLQVQGGVIVGAAASLGSLQVAGRMTGNAVGGSGKSHLNYVTTNGNSNFPTSTNYSVTTTGAMYAVPSLPNTAVAAAIRFSATLTASGQVDTLIVSTDTSANTNTAMEFSVANNFAPTPRYNANPQAIIPINTASYAGQIAMSYLTYTGNAQLTLIGYWEPA